MSAKKNLSLFIPFVFPNFDQKYVANAFANIGNVDRIDFVAKQDRAGKTYNAVYVHFKEWYNNKEANDLYEQCFQKNEKYEYYHDDSEYFWIILPNTAKKHIPGERKPRIGLGDANSINVKSVEKTSEEEFEETKFEETKFEVFKKYLHVYKEQREDELAEIEAEMESSINKMEAEDKNLISIDWRYVQAIEEENKWFHKEIAQLRTALINLDQMYQVEAAKVRAFSILGTSADL
jgi:hypothetical protein